MATPEKTEEEMSEQEKALEAGHGQRQVPTADDPNPGKTLREQQEREVNEQIKQQKEAEGSGQPHPDNTLPGQRPDRGRPNEDKPDRGRPNEERPDKDRGRPNEEKPDRGRPNEERPDRGRPEQPAQPKK